MITVGLDARCLNTTHLRGMGKALLRLLEAASADPSIRFEAYSDEPRAPLHTPPGSSVVSRVWEVPGHRFRAWERFGLPAMARRQRCDVLHAFGTWAPAWQPVPTVVTIHDVLPWEEDAPSRYLSSTLPAAYRRAAAILTPSQNSARDIAARWPELEGKTQVIPWGIDDAYLQPISGDLPPTLTAAGVSAPYLLYFGGQIPRKRLDWAIDVWASVAATDPRLSLVVCGLEIESRSAWQDRIPTPLRDRFRCLDFIEESMLPALYAGADAVLYPTLYEGFGFPALEAQAVGTPVLFSAVGSLAELAGPDAFVLPPTDLAAWRDAVVAARRRPRGEDRAGRAWARSFAWSRAWSQLRQVYEVAAATTPR